ncbi:MAG: ABC transporter permease [Boseongicola sp.]
MSKNPLGEKAPDNLLHRILDSDIFYSFCRSPIVVISAVVTAIYFIGSAFAPWIAPHDPFNPASLDLMEAFTPPAWEADGMSKFLLGTDDQGRDVLSTIIFGSRVSLIVGFSAVGFSIIIGVGLGLLAGYLGGWIETIVMRMADVQLTIPAILVALMIDGVARIVVPVDMRDDMAIYVLILAIGISDWPRYARVTRGAALVERNKEYVSAARVIGVHPLKIMFSHVLPNVMGPVLVLGTIGLALAIITEATLSFLGVGVPPTQPSLGTLIRVGNNFLFSGEWWITLFPSLALVILVLAVNLLGDWLRDALNPKLR